MRLLLCCSTIILLAVAIAAESPADADALGRDLGSPVFARREAAAAGLRKLGAKARPVLNRIVAGEDAEARERAEAILEEFDWGLYPDTPPKIAERIQTLRRGSVVERVEAMRQLLRLGPEGLQAARTVLQHDFPGDTRYNISYEVDHSLGRLVPEALFAGDAARAESLLLLGCMGTDIAGAMDYAFYHARWGQPAAASKELERLRKCGGQVAKQPTAALAIGHHFAGRHAECRRILNEVFKADIESTLFENLLEEQGAWSELADIGSRGRTVPSIVAMNLFRERMAGRTKNVDDYWKELETVKVSDGATLAAVQREVAAWSLNGRPLEAMEHFGPLPVVKPLMVDMLAARLKFDEAVTLAAAPADAARKRSTGRILANTHLRRGRILAQLGKHAEADAAFDTAMEHLADDRYVIRDLLRAEVRSGHLDKAIQHTADYFEYEEKRSRDRDYYGGSFKPSPFEMLFDDDGDAAKGWWNALALQSPRTSHVQTLQLIRRLLDGRATADEVTTVTASMTTYCKLLDDTEIPPSWHRVQAGRALAAMHRARGRNDLAEKALRAALAGQTVSPDGAGDYNDDLPKAWVYGTNESYRVWVDLGDLVLEQGRPASAAELYLTGWKHFPNNPIPLYHSGRARIAAGDVFEGERRIAVAHQVPLGNAHMRGRFLDELIQRGRLKDLRRERDHVRDTIWRAPNNPGNIWSQLSRADSVLGEHARAAEVVDRYCNYILGSNGFSFVDGRSYLDLPLLVPLHQSLAAAKAGRIPEATALARTILAAVPGHVQLTTTLVPELDRQKSAVEADAIFKLSWNATRKVAKDYPASAWAHAAAANLAANCRRELDAALADATTGVALDPDSKWCREVLAEVHFRRGEFPDASAIMAKLARESPRNHFYRRQLQRFEKGDIASPQPLGPLE